LFFQCVFKTAPNFAFVWCNPYSIFGTTPIFNSKRRHSITLYAVSDLRAAQISFTSWQKPEIRQVYDHHHHPQQQQQHFLSTSPPDHR
jgi:hypothetical protein